MSIHRIETFELMCALKGCDARKILTVRFYVDSFYHAPHRSDGAYAGAMARIGWKWVDLPGKPHRVYCPEH